MVGKQPQRRRQHPQGEHHRALVLDRKSGCGCENVDLLSSKLAGVGKCQASMMWVADAAGLSTGNIP